MVSGVFLEIILFRGNHSGDSHWRGRAQSYTSNYIALIDPLNPVTASPNPCNWAEVPSTRGPRSERVVIKNRFLSLTLKYALPALARYPRDHYEFSLPSFERP